ncbi:hypothetical protein NO393_24330 [Escherichia coli]|nr:hypothetical protein [Escherichia coli]
MTKNKYATVDFDQVNEKGLKSLIAAINKTGVTVIEVDSSNRATTKDGVKVKTAKLVLNDGQILAIQVNDTGDISSVRLNGKAIPNAQSPDIKTLGTVMGQAARKKLRKIPEITDRQSETCCQSGRQETGSKIQLSAPARGKTAECSGGCRL